MEAAPHVNEQRVFFSTGRREGAGLEAIDDLGLVPALFAPCRDLARLRHDFPLVLVRSAAGPGPVRSLAAIVNQVLREAAPKGMAGERVRRQALRIEREIRRRSYAGERGLLSEQWAAAATAIAAGRNGAGGDDALRDTVITPALDGEVIGYDAAMPGRVVAHAWELAHHARARAFHLIVDRLIVRLSDILRAAFIHSEAGARPDALRASMGGPHGDEFDFEAMSRLVGRRAPADELPAARRRRIEWALEVLQAQRFFASTMPSSTSGMVEPYAFRFTDCASAVSAWCDRLPALVDTVKAIAMAELEAGGRYVEAHHDPFFAAFGEHSIGPDDLALFPDYLVCIEPGRSSAPENANLLEMLSSGMPVKVLVTTGDALEEAVIGAGAFAFGVRSARLAMTATSLGGVFVLQAPGSDLHALDETLAAGMRHRGPALFSVFAGCEAPAAGLPAYLTAAASKPARAFPSFRYDPHAGDNQAARFSLEDNPEPGADWPASPFEYADERFQRVTGKLAFTFADFALCDRRKAGHFARVPKERWNEAMLPVADWLQLGEDAAAERVPYVLAVDGDDVLHRVIVDARMMQAVRRSLRLWHRLQESGAAAPRNAAPAPPRAAASAAPHDAASAAAPAAASAPPPAPAATTPAPTPVAAQVEPAAVSDRDPDMPWIETSRCPSCNECQLINDRLFLYDENRQARIGDLKSGTYRQMVEAAESCQVAIIHPGRPWDPNEPGLDELIERAKPFQ